MDAAAGPTAGEIVARLDRLPASRTIWRMTVMLSLGVFFEFWDLLSSGYIAPGLVREGILTPTTTFLFGLSGVASFIASFFLGLFVGTIACGTLADMFGRRFIFTWSLVWYVAANVVMAFMHDADSVNFWRFMSGIGIGVELVTIDTYIAELVPKHARGRAFACSQAVGFLAVPIVAALAYWLVPQAPLGFAGWRWVVLIGAHSAVLVWFVRLALPESPRWLAERGRLAEADAVMRRIEARVEAETGVRLPPPAAPEPVRPHPRFMQMWQGVYAKRSVMLIIFNVLQTVGFYGFLNWVPTLLIKQGITVTTSLQYTFLIAIAAPVGPLLGLAIGDRVERKYLIMAAAFGDVVFGLLFSQAAGLWQVVGCGVGLTLCNNILSYSFHGYQTELYPTGIRARAVGFVYSWSRLSAVFTSFLIAFLLSKAGTTGVFVFIAAAMMGVVMVIGAMGPKTNNIALEALSR